MNKASVCRNLTTFQRTTHRSGSIGYRWKDVIFIQFGIILIGWYVGIYSGKEMQ